MVLCFNSYTEIVYQRPYHFTSQILHGIYWRRGEIAFFMAWAITFIQGDPIEHMIVTGVPDPLVGIYFVKTMICTIAESHGIENKKFYLRAPKGSVSVTGTFEISFSLLCYVSRVSTVVVSRDWISDVGDTRCRSGKKRINLNGARIGYYKHVRFINRLEPSYA